jgi:hypothetical protein
MPKLDNKRVEHFYEKLRPSYAEASRAIRVNH